MEELTPNNKLPKKKSRLPDIFSHTKKKIDRILFGERCKLKMQYDKRFEYMRVKNALEKMDRYREKGYANIRLPQGVDENSSMEDIQAQVDCEQEENFREHKRGKSDKQVSEDISSGFNAVQDQFKKTLEQVFGKKVPDAFIIQLTNYGNGGGYGTSKEPESDKIVNRVIFNLNNKKGVKTIFHEIVHLFVEPLLEKYGLETSEHHWEKERIVDLILNSPQFAFLQYNEYRDDYAGAETYIDELFQKYFFKDKDMFFQEVVKAHAHKKK